MIKYDSPTILLIELFAFHEKLCDPFLHIKNTVPSRITRTVEISQVPYRTKYYRFENMNKNSANSIRIQMVTTYSSTSGYWPLFIKQI